jgi:hypothetical protein
MSEALLPKLEKIVTMKNVNYPHSHQWPNFSQKTLSNIYRELGIQHLAWYFCYKIVKA